jgi:hypothetical protein
LLGRAETSHLATSTTAALAGELTEQRFLVVHDYGMAASRGGAGLLVGWGRKAFAGHGAFREGERMTL